MEQKKQAGRLAELRKYIPTSQDAEIVKEMIADGLSNEDILHALGYVDSSPSNRVLPNGHDSSNQQTSEQEEQAALQPGEAVGGEEEGGGEDDMLGHIAGILTHVSKKKNPPRD